MPRPSLLVPALAVLALLVTAPVASAAVDSVTTDLELPTNNNLVAHLDVFNDEFDLEIGRKDQTSYASYEVDGEATEAGLKASFGQLGVIDMAFRPTEVELEQPPKGCTGPPSKFSDGVLAGTFSFTGDQDFVRIDVTEIEAHLENWREAEWRCPSPQRRAHRNRAPRPLPFLARPSSEAKAEDEATLVARKRRCRCVFVGYAFPNESRKTSSGFFGAQFEKREGMEITRATGGSAPTSAFTFNHKAGTATVRPRSPILGYGHFERRPHGRDLWRSTIRVPLLGADPIDMRDGGYHATLVDELPEFR
jgi:hypothetical protein